MSLRLFAVAERSAKLHVGRGDGRLNPILFIKVFRNSCRYLCLWAHAYQACFLDVGNMYADGADLSFLGSRNHIVCSSPHRPRSRRIARAIRGSYSIFFYRDKSGGGDAGYCANRLVGLAGGPVLVRGRIQRQSSDCRTAMADRTRRLRGCGLFGGSARGRSRGIDAARAIGWRASIVEFFG